MKTYEYGLWPLVIVNIAVFIIFAFSFFRPKSSVDWTAFGGLSAFLIALFTEMYGFPLTLFLLAPWLEKHFPGVNPFAHNTGMLWSVFFHTTGDPMMSPYHTFTMILIVLGSILIFSAWGTLYSAHKNQKLAKTGLYHYIRHPQYDGFLLIMFGYLLMWPTILTLFMFPVLVFMYIRLAKKEEKMVVKEFGVAYRKYKAKVPAFIPKINLFKPIPVTKEH